ncbi:MAG: class I SAM-dependent methyltransferase [Clostridiales bacterium]|nr:class I SAM-dependent methyltransferase [Clostridiales bacterium]
MDNQAGSTLNGHNGRVGARVKLSRRISALAEMLPDTEALADIGTDHARLLSALVEAGKIQRGIGVEIARGPYRRAVANVAALGYEGKIEIRLGDGLEPVAPGEVTACAAAGMGGGTIIRILERGAEVAAGLSWLLLQPMTGAKALRFHLQQNGWEICREALTEDRGALYEIILARRGSMAPLSPLEAEFGPLILAEKPPQLSLAVCQRIHSLRGISGQLEKSSSAANSDKKEQLQAQIREWEALLSCLIPAGTSAGS